MKFMAIFAVLAPTLLLLSGCAAINLMEKPAVNKAPQALLPPNASENSAEPDKCSGLVPMDKVACYYKISYDTQDPSICDKIEPSFKGVCTILANRSFESCSNAGREKQLCVDSYARASENETMCMLLSEYQFSCVAYVAAAKNDLTICNLLRFKTATDLGGNIDEKGFCYNRVAMERKDATICTDVPLASSRDDCYFDVASEMKDSSICDNVQDSGAKRFCILYSNAGKNSSAAKPANNISNTGKNPSAVQPENKTPTQPANQTPMLPANGAFKENGTGTLHLPDYSGAYYRGSANASVVMVEYADFQTSFCGSAAVTISQLIQDYGNLKFIYRHYPMPSSFHEYSQKAAEASLCAGKQGKFWEMHDRIYNNQGAMAIGDLKSHAIALGLNKDAFDSCLDGGETALEVSLETAEGNGLGVKGTPTFLAYSQSYDPSIPAGIADLNAKLGTSFALVNVSGTGYGAFFTGALPYTYFASLMDVFGASPASS